MIFVDKIKDGLEMTDAFRSLLTESMYKKRDQIIQIFPFNQKSFRREYFRESLRMEILVAWFA